MIHNNKKLVAVILFCLGIGVGILISKTGPREQKTADLGTFWQVWNMLEEKYPFSDQVPTEQEKVDSAISGLVSSYGDPYMQYFNEKSLDVFKGDISGEFSGIGAELGIRDGLLTVIAPLKDSPSEKAGLLAQDIIVKIDGEESVEMSIDEAISKIRGKKGEVVTLSVARKGNQGVLEIPIERDTVKVPTLDVAYHSGVPTLSLYSFDQHSADLFAAELAKIDFKKNKTLIIDLRNNPGGYLDSAVAIAGMMLPAGKMVVTEKPGVDGISETTEHHSAGIGLVPDDVKIAVLVDGGSASASEILAGALQDHKRATIIGSQSFGKGSVQELITLPDNSGVKITVAKWYTPNGTSISKSGVTPDVVVSQKERVADSDPVIEKAVAFLAR